MPGETVGGREARAVLRRRCPGGAPVEGSDYSWSRPAGRPVIQAAGAVVAPSHGVRLPAASDKRKGSASVDIDGRYLYL